MYYGEIKRRDIANGPGVRVSLFVSGCRHHCPNCFNRETLDFRYGQPFTSKQAEQILNDLKPDFISGFTLLGGEPFEPENQKDVCELLKLIRSRLPHKTIWCFTGGVLETDGQNGPIRCCSSWMCWLTVPLLKRRKTCGWFSVVPAISG